MSVVQGTPLDSKYGFRSPQFSVDENGNIIATSISLASENPSNADFTVTESASDFIFSTLGVNPVLQLSKSQKYTFNLILPTLGFTIYGPNQQSLFNTGLVHSDGTFGVNAQGKTSGTLSFSIPPNAPSQLWYGSTLSGTIFGSIEIIDPIGVFNNVTISATTDSNNLLTGALIVSGGAAIHKTLNVGSIINTPELSVLDIRSSGNLTLQANGNIVIVGSDSSVVGVISNSGSTIPINNTSVNGTTIGDITPSSATFTTATITGVVTQPNSVSTKQYVDNISTALAIAFGL
jgi:hypothetical protein